jgi:hypothetical protein
VTWPNRRMRARMCGGVRAGPESRASCSNRQCISVWLSEENWKFREDGAVRKEQLTLTITTTLLSDSQRVR